MRLSSQPSHASRTHWFYWRRRDTRYAIGLLGIAVLAYAVAHFYELPARAAQGATTTGTMSVGMRIVPRAAQQAPVEQPKKPTAKLEPARAAP
jgi:hypothetical protein